MRKLVRLTIAIGGFLIVTSLILTGTVLLALLDIIDVKVITEQPTVSVLTLMFIAIGIADFIAGIIFLLKR
jgi:NADH:ubiquinone oxidoreductase subunit 5 (subunit L)/multisubunit Na+/H+ antiporter MnhA subunit